MRRASDSGSAKAGATPGRLASLRVMSRITAPNMVRSRLSCRLARLNCLDASLAALLRHRQGITQRRPVYFAGKRRSKPRNSAI
jgi:hypothetical protein